MIFPLYIARRYLFAKKSHNIINVISVISVFGIAMGTMALVIVLSVFNGFENLVTNLFNAFNPDLRITATEGKSFHTGDLHISELEKIPGVLCITQVIEENALLKYREKQYIVTIKGVDENFSCTSDLQNCMVEGEYRLESGPADYAVVGQGIAYNLGLVMDDFENPLAVYVPRRGANKSMNLLDAFSMEQIMPSGFFGIQQDFDIKYVIVPLRFSKILLDYPDLLTAVEMKIESAADMAQIQEAVQQISGKAFTVKNRFQQEEMLFRIMKAEKMAVFVILAFILIIATFNVIGALSMLILDKRKDIAVLKSLGATNRTIRRIFMSEGLLISLSGAVIGLLLGFIICGLQHQFGFISIQNSGSFVVDAYPVKMQFADFLMVLLLNILIGFLAAWYPVKYISRKYFSDKL